MSSVPSLALTLPFFIVSQRADWYEERLTILFDLAMAHLIDRKVLLPGVSVLERAISSVREHASRRLWQLLAAIPTPSQRALLETLLEAPPGERQTPLDRLRTIHDLDAAAQILAQACQIVLDETQDPVTLLQRIYTSVPSEHLRAAVTTIGELTRPPDDNYAQELLGRYLMMRRFLPTFWLTLQFESTPGGRPTLQVV